MAADPSPGFFTLLFPLSSIPTGVLRGPRPTHEAPLKGFLSPPPIFLHSPFRWRGSGGRRPLSQPCCVEAGIFSLFLTLLPQNIRLNGSSHSSLWCLGTRCPKTLPLGCAPSSGGAGGGGDILGVRWVLGGLVLE